jgi:hypothetical protein
LGSPQSLKALSRHAAARATPCSAALRYQRAAWTASRDTPRPLSYNVANWNWASRRSTNRALVGTRHRPLRDSREIQRGIVVGATYRNVDAAFYVFNPDDSKPVVVGAVTVEF